MNRKAIFVLLILVVSLTALPVFAQDGAAASNEFDVNSMKFLAIGFSMAIGVALGAFGQSRVAAAACEGAARNPGAAAKIQLMMILGLAFIESLVLFLLVVLWVKIPTG